MLHVVGRRLDPEDHRLRDFLTRIAQPHEFHEAGTLDAEAGLAEAGAVGTSLPVVVDGDTVHVHATVESLANAGRSTRVRRSRTKRLNRATFPLLRCP